MRSTTAVLVLLAACTSSGEDLDLDETAQGECTNQAEAACLADARCQGLYVDSGFQPEPFFRHCLEVEPPVPTTAACPATREECRTRADCAVLYWQKLGPADEPVGDPYYTSCVDESSVQ